MTLLTDIANYIDTNTSLTLGTDLFIGTLPSTAENCVGIFQTGGVEPSAYVKIKKPTLQVMVRNTNYETAQDLSYTIYDLLHQLIGRTAIGGTTVLTVFALQEPTEVGEDTTGRALFTTNYVFEIS